MLKLFTMLLYFIKEIFTHKKDELDFSNAHFNLFTWVKYILTIVFVLGFIFFAQRTFVFAFQITELKALNEVYVQRLIDCEVVEEKEVK